MRVHEQFTSYQGTGKLMGVRQRFVRLAGCSVPCPLRRNCDQAESLPHSAGHEVSIAEILREAEGEEWLHITGGEPAEHPEMVDLCYSAQEAGMKVQVQTSGHYEIHWRGVSPFVSVSPKTQTLRVPPSEICLVACIWLTDALARRWTENFSGPVYVVPEAHGGDFSCERTLAVVDMLRLAGRDAMPSLQAHLLWKVR